MPRITLSGLRNIEGAPADDGQAIWLRLTNNDGTTFQTALNEKSLNEFLGLMINLVQELGKRTAPPDGPTREISAVPVPAARLGVSKGRSETEAILAVQMGPVSLSFALELSVLTGMCEALQKVLVEGRQVPRH